MKVKVASFSTLAHWGDEEVKSLEKAVAYVREAAAAGAQLICFPEGYPGPCHGPFRQVSRSEEPVVVFRPV